MDPSDEARWLQSLIDDAVEVVEIFGRLKALRDTTASYRFQMIEAGFSEVDASTMAVDYHRELLSALLRAHGRDGGAT